jgi:hypothetical protein
MFALLTYSPTLKLKIVDLMAEESVFDSFKEQEIFFYSPQLPD